VRITDVVGLRLEARNFLLWPRSGIGDAHLDNVVVGAGLSFGFGAKGHDADQDGIPDRKDQCPGTPLGCLADVTGCPIDSDGDGVCNGLDKCPDTRKGAKVDASGCPLDQDHDGVPDGIDRCPGTPRDCQVDQFGCPADADRDGVCDQFDQCANTVFGCKVDAKGCAIDSDGDGVCDGIDRCPNTPGNVHVDTLGCPRPTAVQAGQNELLDTGMIRVADVSFDATNTKVLPESRPALDVAGEVFSQYPQLLVEIGGHTDSRGSDALNREISLKRANAVRAYLLRKFPSMTLARVSTRGYGGTKPIAPNTTPAGMAKNRRIEFRVLNPDELRRIPR
jgi:outer membrane protein OmpA-like peptidoglycan-associated protein